MKNLYFSFKESFLKIIFIVYSYALNLGYTKRKFLIISLDALIIFGCFLSTIKLNEDKYLSRFYLTDDLKPLLTIAFFSVIFIYFITGQYRGITRYYGSKIIYKLASRNFIAVIFCNFLLFIFADFSFSISDCFVFWLRLTFFSSLSRVILRDFLVFMKGIWSHPPKVIIYGAGNAGAQLAASSRIGRDYEVLAFIDDSPELWGRNLNGLNIYSPSLIHEFKDNIDYVLLAIPSINQARRFELIKSLQEKNLKVLQIPSIEDLKTGRAKIDKLKPISINDLLPRKSALPDLETPIPELRDAVVCVTGGAGSIGSELSKQILKNNPKKLIIIDHSEPSLYKLDQKLKGEIFGKTEFIPILGNVVDYNFLKKIFNDHKVGIIFHAAAYKHVPLVEDNPMSGIANNILSTFNVCKCAKEMECTNAILISTDKAVRPTNIMGASKRFSELIFQAYAEKTKLISKDNRSSKTLFSMVRFGNVLASSGSVVPLFMKQIDKGGPITLTHKDVTRFFMTIPEAAHLVIQSVPLSQGGDVFLLDMGEPVRIIDLAKQLVSLSGLTLKDENNPKGDIEIIFTGLRSGEKLFEELLLDGTYYETTHKKIFRAVEKFIPFEKLIPKIENLKSFVISGDLSSTLKLLEDVVPEWIPNKSIQFKSDNL